MKFIGQFGEQGVRYYLHVPKGQAEVLSRQVPFYSPKSSPRIHQGNGPCFPLSVLLAWQVVKSDSASATVPEIELEIPTATQKGTITTVEGLLSEAASGLRALQAIICFRLDCCEECGSISCHCNQRQLCRISGVLWTPQQQQLWTRSWKSWMHA